MGKLVQSTTHPSPYIGCASLRQSCASSAPVVPHPHPRKHWRNWRTGAKPGGIDGSCGGNPYRFFGTGACGWATKYAP